MPPKKKSNKKAADDDWEAELGKNVAAADSTMSSTTDTKDDGGGEDGTADGPAPVGGLMAALRKNRSKKQKKGKVVEEFEGQEDLLAESGEVDFQAVDLASKAPAEGTVDDEEFGAA
jgi:translation initiation factor 5B